MLLCWGPPLQTCTSQHSLALRKGVGVQRAIVHMARVLLTGFSAGISLWEQDCTAHRVHEELEQVILPCLVLSGLSLQVWHLYLPSGWLHLTDFLSDQSRRHATVAQFALICKDSCGNDRLASPLLLSQHPGPKAGCTSFLLAWEHFSPKKATFSGSYNSEINWPMHFERV